MKWFGTAAFGTRYGVQNPNPVSREREWERSIESLYLFLSKWKREKKLNERFITRPKGRSARQNPQNRTFISGRGRDARGVWKNGRGGRGEFMGSEIFYMGSGLDHGRESRILVWCQRGSGSAMASRRLERFKGWDVGFSWRCSGPFAKQLAWLSTNRSISSAKIVDLLTKGSNWRIGHRTWSNIVLFTHKKDFGLFVEIMMSTHSPTGKILKQL